MPVFRTDIWIAATIYVKANTSEEAAAIINARDFDGIELQEQELYDDDSEFAISGLNFDSESLPNVSLSPAMTLYTRTMEGLMSNQRLLTANDMDEAG